MSKRQLQACYSIITNRLLSDIAKHRTAEAAELGMAGGLLIEPVVTDPGEQKSTDVATKNVVEAATAAALKDTPPRTIELAPAGSEPSVTVS